MMIADDVSSKFEFLTDPVFRHRVASRIAKDSEFDERVSARITSDERLKIAARILREAEAFLSLIADNPGVGFSPSPLVDIGWHNLILYTREYAKFCQQRAGRFIHHAPFDEVGVNYGTGHAQRTVETLRASGWAVDEELWSQQFVYECGTCQVGGYDCSSTDQGSPRQQTPNDGNCGGQDSGDACGGPDGIVGRARAALGFPNNGNCGGQDCSDACGGPDGIVGQAPEPKCGDASNPD